MTSASITSTPRTPTKRTPPDPQRVFQTYQAECAINSWGAYKRTGDRYQRSDEWARKVVKKYLTAREPKPIDPNGSTPAEPDELAYQPPPGAYPEPKPSPAQERAAQVYTANQASLRQAPTLELPTEPSTVAEESPTEAGAVTSTPNVDGNDCQPVEPANSQPFELRNVGDLPLPTVRAAPVQVVTRVVRVPVERPQSPLVAWWQDHEAARKQLLGLAVLLLLIAATWLG